MPEDKIQQPAIVTQAFKGAPHGHTTFDYKPGDPCPAELAAGQVSLGNARFLKEGEDMEAAKAEIVGAAKPAPEENAGIAAAPENKGAGEGEGKEGGEGTEGEENASGKRGKRGKR